MFNKEYMISQQ